MQQVNFYRVEISDGSGIIKGDNKFEKKVLNVIGENANCFVVDDDHFTTVRLAHSKYMTCLDRQEISINNDDSVWGNRITYTLFTTTAKRAKTIRKEIEAEVSKRFGFFTGKLDLGIIVD